MFTQEKKRASDSGFGDRSEDLYTLQLYHPSTEGDLLRIVAPCMEANVQVGGALRMSCTCMIYVLQFRYHVYVSSIPFPYRFRPLKAIR